MTIHLPPQALELKPNALYLFVWLVQHADDYGNVEVSVRSLSKATGLSVREVRTALLSVSATHLATQSTTHRGSLATIVNIDSLRDSQCVTDTLKDTVNDTLKKKGKGSPLTLSTPTKEEGEKKEKASINIDAKRKKFVKPSIEDIKAYIEDNGITSVDAQAFFYFYESKGWVVGKSPMKDWHAAVRTWMRSRKPNTQQQTINYTQDKDYGTRLNF